MNRRAFFGLLTGVLAALGFKTNATNAQAKPIELEPMRDNATWSDLIDPGVKWGPGKQHPHWRVPQGRWTFVEDK